MKFIKTLLFDLYNGIVKKVFLFICPILISVFALLDCLNKINSYLNNPDISYTQHSMGDLWFYIYGGMEKYVPAPGDVFSFPVIWTFVFFVCALLVLNYPTKDMLGAGAHYLVGGGSRSKWWISKVIWNILSTIIYHGMIFLVIVVLCIVSNIDIRLGINEPLIEYLYEFKNEVFLYFVTSIPVTVVLLPVLISIAMNLLQMTLTLFLQPVHSFIVNCGIMVASAYMMTGFFVYNFAMPLRYKWIYEGGFNYKYGYIVAAGIIIVSVAVGLIRFKHYDIIKKEDN